ncbi:MAG: cytochrome c oxidase subunit II [Candidatus Latescibacterota bacterium]
MRDFPLFPEQASTIAGQVDALYFLLLGLAVLFGLATFVVLVVFALRYRRRGEGERPRPIHGSLVLELAWTIIPMFMALGVFTLGAGVFFRMQRPPADPLNVYVVGKQWMWKVQHEAGKREINELHVPIGTPVQVTLTSEDVIHDFYVPAFRVKQDAVPGRYTSLWFEATKLGEYHLFCAEYCGTQHSGMIGKVIVMEPAAFQAWLTADPQSSAATVVEAGARQFERLGCQSCHRHDDSGRGPSLRHLMGSTVRLASGEVVNVDEAYVRQSILRPRSQVVTGYETIMPVYEGQISEETLLQLVSYIRSLGEGGGPLQGTTAPAPAPQR